MAKTEERRFQAGEIIFLEGEDSDAAFMVEAGTVELSKVGPQGNIVKLASLGKGELFGEIGVLDKGPRNITARCETAVTVKVIPRAQFLRLMETEPSAALKMMTRMARRLRAADERIVAVASAPQPRPVAAAPGTALVPVPGGGGQGGGGGHGIGGPGGPVLPPGLTGARTRPTLIGRLLDALRGGPPRHVVVGRTAEVAVAPLSLDPEFDQRPYLIEALQGLDRVTVRDVKGALPAVPEGQMVRDLRATRIAARQLLADDGADLLVWGGEDASGRVIELRFSAAADPLVARGGFGPPEDVALTIPADFDDGWHPLLRAVTVAALGGAPAALLRLVEQAKALGLAPPQSLSAPEAAEVLGAFGYAAAAAGLGSGRVDALGWAAQAYRDAIARLPRDAHDQWAQLNKALGLVLQATAERLPQSEQEGPLRDAVAAFKNALQGVNRDADPRGFGALHARLGGVLFRLDKATGDEQALKDAIGHLQYAVQVFTRAEDPWRWAELMNTIAQVLQVYGDHFKSMEALRKAVEVCRQACEVRTPEAAPLLYAATRNNMGSALFLIAKYSGDAEAMRLASVAFRDALAAYRDGGGGGRLTAIIEKNLARAEDLLRRHEGRSVAEPGWASEASPEAAEDEADAAAAAAGTGEPLRADAFDRIRL
ncbi:cyclic nucleotide-binding domain-containing protein [Novispirillum sp. DQ9]|uniref:cyclic nucleotide-binding domain-containing protein n=1 Tax=Novispirillum sp. DQ9 TaxID=3398612 RepID=UPI003C7AABDA